MADAVRGRRTRSGGTKGSSIVTVNLTASSLRYLSRLLELGALEGSSGKTDVSPSLQPVIQAMHHVLAGGSAEIKITQKGDPTVVRELNGLLRQGNREAVQKTRSLSQPPVLRV